jgi:hypothetical protein
VDFIQVFGKMELHPALLQTARHKRQHPPIRVRCAIIMS